MENLIWLGNKTVKEVEEMFKGKKIELGNVRNKYFIIENGEE